MKPSFILVCTVMLSLTCLGLTAQAAPGDLRLSAQLITGSKDTDAKGNPVSPDIEKKLKRLPLKWDYYNVITNQTFVLPKDGVKTISLAPESGFTVKNLGAERVELTVSGRGKITQSLRKGQTLVTGGNNEDSIIVLWQVN